MIRNNHLYLNTLIVNSTVVYLIQNYQISKCWLQIWTIEKNKFRRNSILKDKQNILKLLKLTNWFISTLLWIKIMKILRINYIQ
jgi:hypothetical protein